MYSVTFRSLAAWMGLAATTSVWAQTAYVIDRLAVGIHAERALDSAIVKVLPTGTPLDVLAKDGEFARVRTSEGLTGWVDVNYIMTERPAQLVAADLKAKHREATAQLELARAEVAQLKSKVKKLEQSAGSSETPFSSDALREMEKLAVENQELKQQLALRHTGGESGTPADSGAVHTSNTAKASLSKWTWALFGFTLLLSFALGGYWVDYQVRRRHGGFRV